MRTRGGAASEAAAITELVIVEAMRTSNSGGELMWQSLDDMSGEERIKISGLGSHELARKNVASLQRTAATNLTRDKSVDASLKRRGRKKVSCTMNSQ